MNSTPVDIQKLKRAQDVVRGEDTTLVTGAGTYTDDLRFDDCCYGAVVRADIAAATILSIDTSKAANHEHAVGIILGQDLVTDGISGIPFASTVNAPNGRPPACEKLPVLAHRMVRYVGQPVVFVVANSRAAAHEMAEMVDITYASHDCVTNVVEAATEGAPLVDESTLNNVAAIHELGDKMQCTKIIQRSTHSLNLTVTNNRVIANPMEPRSCVGQFDNETARWTLHCGNQGPHHSRRMLAAALGCDEERLRILVHRIGGGFGAKLTPYPEDALVLYAARKFNRPVRWRCDRSEAFLADFHARDHVADITIGFDDNYRITALVIENLANLGAYPSPFGIPIATTTGNRIVNGVYQIPELALSVKTVLTHTAPTAPYRGAGRPESIHRLEVTLDAAAKQFNIDPAELRRRNLISPEQIPYKAHSGLTYDSGNFLNVLERALKLANWTDFPERKARSAQQGMVRGRGLACHIDSTSGVQPTETVKACVDTTGHCTFYSGTQEMGQGLNHTYTGMVASILELPLENITIVQGDTDAVTSGVGSYGSRSLMIGGAAVVQAAHILVEKLRAMGANALETEADNVHYTRGTVRTNDGDQQVTVGEIAGTRLNGRIEVEATAEAPFSFPNGCYVCELDIDPDTGAIRVDKFIGVDDLGNVINETLVHGQTHGGLAQGIGQALFEQIIYSHTGELLTGSTLDYPLPRADDLPAFDITVDESQPATTNSLGIKGAGECGAVGGPAAVMSAVINALPNSAVASLQMPLTTEKIWRALNS